MSTKKKKEATTTPETEEKEAVAIEEPTKPEEELPASETESEEQPESEGADDGDFAALLDVGNYFVLPFDRVAEELIKDVVPAEQISRVGKQMRVVVGSFDMQSLLLARRNHLGQGGRMIIYAPKPHQTFTGGARHGDFLVVQK